MTELTVPNCIHGRLTAIAEKVEKELNLILPTNLGQADCLSRAMRYAVLGGGKRLRPILLVQTGNLFGVSDDQLIRSGTALELVHCYSLIHDDLPCMDDDDFRRGQPTVHRKFDEATAVLAGDALLTLAFEVMADESTHFDPSIRIQLISELARASGDKGMVGGQMLDIRAGEGTLDQQYIERMQQLKTGALFRFAVFAGCLIGEASGTEIQTLLRFAENFGLAYQIADDIADAEIETGALAGNSAPSSHREAGNFVTIFGLKETKSRLAVLTKECLDCLKPLEERGEFLSETVRYLLKSRTETTV